jgi:hypothetical protein
MGVEHGGGERGVRRGKKGAAAFQKCTAAPSAALLQQAGCDGGSSGAAHAVAELTEEHDCGAAASRNKGLGGWRQAECTCEQQRTPHI